MAQAPPLPVPFLLMGYYNPFLAYGLERLGADLAAARCSGLIVPDLPLEEAAPLRSILGVHGLALVQLVAPASPPARQARLAAESEGFVYAVTVAGTTGGTIGVPEWLPGYLDDVRALTDTPVLAGFGIREAAQVEALADHADGLVVGSALLEAIDAGRDAAEVLSGLRAGVGSG